MNPSLTLIPVFAVGVTQITLLENWDMKVFDHYPAPKLLQVMVAHYGRKPPIPADSDVIPPVTRCVCGGRGSQANQSKGTAAT